jgi:putative ABC transport system ATP-binding protein
MFGGASIAMSPITACGRTARTARITATTFARVESTSNPRNASFAPVSSTKTSTGPRNNHGTRLSAPAEVSPLNPAFTTWKGNPAESIFRCSSAGYASSGSRPSPAVSDVPIKTTVRGGTLDPASSTKIPRQMLIARNLTKEYPSGDGTVTALDNVSFDIPPGTFAAITGASGSGKTTLLALLAGLDTPTRGTTLLDDVDLATLTEDGRARLRGEKVGFVFQSFQLIPTLTALENVAVPLELRGTPGANDHAAEWLGRVGLAPRANHFPAQLSGGEQQRVAIARAFVNKPRVLFADEPTGNLDRASGSRVLQLLESLNRESGVTIMLVTHEPDLAERAQRIIRLADGRVVD